ncbi:MAG: response regulator [Nitrospirales bacterium]
MEKLLLVDDEPNVLDALQRQLRHEYRIVTAPDAEQAITILRVMGPFAMIVSDCQMPGINGIQFLALARKMAPDTVRIMLTGNHDVHTAMQAVNNGEIYRFLTKPCATEALQKSIKEAIEHYRLKVANKGLANKS